MSGLDSIRNNFPDISGAFSDAVTQFKQQSTVNQLLVSGVAIGVFVGLSVALAKVVSAIKNRNVTPIDPLVQQNEVSQFAVDAKKKFDTISADLKSLEAIAKADADKAKDYAKTAVISVADNASDAEKTLAGAAKKKIEALKEKAKVSAEAVKQFAEDHLEPAKTALAAVDENAKNYGVTNVTPKDKAKAFDGIKASVAHLEAIAKEAVESSKDAIAAFVAKKDEAAAIVLRNEKAALIKQKKELEASAANFVEQNRSTLVAGTAASVALGVVEFGALPLAGFAIYAAPAVLLATLAIAGAKTAINHFNAPQTTA